MWRPCKPRHVALGIHSPQTNTDNLLVPSWIFVHKNIPGGIAENNSGDGQEKNDRQAHTKKKKGRGEA